MPAKIDTQTTGQPEADTDTQALGLPARIALLKDVTEESEAGTQTWFAGTVLRVGADISADWVAALPAGSWDEA